MSKPPKLTRKFLKTLMKQRLAIRTFDRQQFMKEFDIPDRRARRLLNEIAEELADIKTPELEILKSYCIEELTEKVKNKLLSEKALIKIALSGEVARAEIKSDTNLNITGLDSNIQKLIVFSKQEDQKNGS